MKLSVIKIGGDIIDDEAMLTHFITGFSSLPGRKILVHGGGKVATRTAQSLGIKTVMKDGRRITTDKMIDVVTMTYAGLINKKIVGQLQSNSINAIGLTGVDGNLIQSDKRPVQNGIDYGWVGDPKKVNAELVRSFINSALTPVIAPLTHDIRGNLLNTNADTIASTLAIAMNKYFDVELNYCLQQGGVMEDVNQPDSLVKQLSYRAFDRGKKDGTISNGMIPKLDNAFEAAKKGVSKVRVMSHRSISQLEKSNFDEFTSIL